MKRTKATKLLSVLMALVMVLTCLVTPAMANPAQSGEPTSAAITAVNDAETGETTYIEASGIDPELDPNKEITIMVEVEGQTMYQQTGDLQIAAVGYDDQMAVLAKAESRIEAALNQTIKVDSRYSLLFNGFSFTGCAWMIDAINELEGVFAFEAPVFELIEAESSEDETLNPSMSTSTGMTRATDAWELGYTGEGMVVAVIDSGIRQTHEVFSVMPENGRITEQYLQDVFDEYGDKLHCGTNVEDIYYNEKLPFNWDYNDGDADPSHTASDHGTHVAGIVAGNNGDDFNGVAPDAQIVTMQVSDNSGGISLATLMEALEDCVYLEVDAINMSLGVTAYFTAYESISSRLEGVYDSLEEAGITICAAAGNDSHSNFWTNPTNGYDNGWFSWNVDAGTIGAPATFAGSFAVASAVNTSAEGGGYISAYGVDYYPSASVTSTTPTFASLPSGEYDIVYAGLASPEELAQLDVKGKIVLSERGVITFGDKGVNAAAAGAVGILVYNNVSGPVATSAVAPIPFGTITMEAGMALRENFADGVNGKVTVCNDFAYGSVEMALTSSWGTTSDLKIKPEITAPGDDVTSAIGFGDDSSYATWSGTSMATPHVSGGMMLIKQRLREEFPDKTASEINELAYSFMMSTAHQINSNVRRTGAGLMDLESALTTQAYLSVPGSDRPKLELDDSENGEFTFTFEVNNFGDTEKTYDIVTTVLSELSGEMEYSGYREEGLTLLRYKIYNMKNDYFVSNPTATVVKLMKGAVNDVTNQCDITGPETVTVEAGGTATVEMTIKASEELLTYIKENFPSGMYLEGYVVLEDQAAEGVDLSIPFLGFVGDWDYGPMFDLGFWWNLPYGINNMAQMPTTQGTYIGAGVLEQGLGLNYYVSMKGQTYNEDRNAISPNGDGRLDKVSYIEFSLMRNPKTLKLYVQDAEGNVVKTLHESTYNFRKEYFVQGNNGGTGYSSLVFDYVADEMEENETAYIVLEAWLDHEEYDPADNQNGRMVFPVTKDLTAPAVSIVDGGIEILDTNYIAYYAVYSDSQRKDLLFESGVFADERGQTETYLTDRDTLFVTVADYARNEAFYMVRDGEVIELASDGFDHETKEIIGRSFIDWSFGGHEYAWYTFNPETPNAVTAQTVPTTELNYYALQGSGVDYMSSAVSSSGQAYLSSLYYLFTFDPDTYEATEVAKFWSETTTFEPWVKSLMTNPETGEVYAFAYMDSSDGVGMHLAELDLSTGELTGVWRLSRSLSIDPDFFSWAAEFVDDDTVAVWDHTGSIWLVDADDSSLKDEIDLGLVAPSGDNQYGVDGSGGNMLFDEEENMLYLFSPKCAWFGKNRYDTHGYLTLDLDNYKVTMRRVADGSDLAIHGLFFRDDVEPSKCVYYCEQVAADCENEGYNVYTCVDCGKQYRDSIVPASGHSYELQTVEPTCTRAGYTLNVCSVCGQQHIVDVLDPAGHQYQSVVTAPTCTEEGYTTHTCAVCGDAHVTDRVAATGHTFGEWTVTRQESCTEPGEETRACADCGETESREIPAYCPGESFDDVDTTRWYHEGVCFALRNGLMKGMSETTFAPDDTTTRAQLVMVLYRLAGEPSVEGLENPFQDVPADQWYSDAIVWAASEGIVKGINAEGTLFAPRADITREQMVTILYRFHGAAEVDAAVLESYTDAADISDYAVEAFAWAVANDIIEGVTETTLSPQGTATRAQIATVFMRLSK